jgi:ketosteroid isomerase-like protein
MHKELLKLESEFAQAVTDNDVDAVDGFLADDWIIVDPDGGIIDKARFLGVIKSGALSHEMMEPADQRVRLYGNTAVVTRPPKGNSWGRTSRRANGQQIFL